MSAKVLNAYTPPEHFKEVDKLPPVVEEAADDNTELWLVRLPSNEIGQADLLEKKLRLNVNASEGIVGHFSNKQGQDYNIVRQRKLETMQPYAIIPNGTHPLVVRKITCQVGFVRSLKVEAKRSNEENDNLRQRDVGVTQHPQTSALTSEKDQSALLDVEKPSKKKRRKSQLSEKN